MNKKKEASAAQYQKFKVIDVAARPGHSKSAADVISPTINVLQGKDAVNPEDLKGRVVYKRAVPNSRNMDGSSSSKSLIFKGGKLIGAQG
ncbi:MAG TPA: hypothetical protein VEH27_01410 [Methylomirabilota bacterium]|nr:hypothetical protein [Methylomirabilota bacterium]